MKITKKETYDKNKPCINEKLINEYYDIIPHMENEIENLLKKFNVKKYDHKITTLLIDIIQNETLKILLSSKKIQKRAKKTDKLDFDQKNEDNNNILNQASNTTSQEIEKKETIDNSLTHPNDEPNYISKTNSFDQKNEGPQNSLNIDNVIQSENLESISKNTQSISEENGGNMENAKNDQSKENEMEKNSEEVQPKEEEKNGSLFKKLSSFFSKKNNEEEKKDLSKDTKLNNNNNSIQNEKESLVNDTTQLNDSKSSEKNDEQFSILANNDKPGEIQEMETAKDNSNNNKSNPNDINNNYNNNKIENTENINEKNNPSEEKLDKININYDGTEHVNKSDENKKSNKNGNNNASDQEGTEEDSLIIDEESVNQAIREYALKYIYRKKNVDFVYDDPTYEQKDINNVFVDRNIKYPMGFPPHLPDDCSINTILPSWNIQYNFTKKNKSNQYRQ
ncbi:conserved Plasmodium protein, unknown function [Plasmodium berghei]|uniref:Uncharacterized protein n=2 Tax=Plasmodium berghei TaxID=5821 RepID=A0A509AG06_PLABA|nr:conserved Plasmodium protein, unknown function [Plasmodium berghei ANKA]CXI11272.1 conserved Plasmodium protein, unknown function [Plasmodium berghei]SCL93166.1 conserved Plasmodium protein, unknown function [Plasmodium berghei]SCM15802.1 conserved Plasmodium protein, unknown function [Plasmodium berghei]SCM17597.1 conserved Plasmodium protein, unknown function [Plasmodium berghei]SCN23078.1 conserved Plasmodium protein, unknown function [Plasmodium berghei]|eukprot:XP_034420406.1 conserved Plasmodium protein, unknown function [Plasmodium berghei ANKA]